MLTANDVPGALPREMMKHTYPILYEVEESHWWYIGRRRIIGSFVKEICSEITDYHPQILDVGCGTGANLKMLAQFGAAQGVDVSPDAVAFCRQRGLENVKLGAAESLPYEDKEFDLVTALDVLEHMDDDIAGLREMRRVLRTGGRLFLFVPTFMFLWGIQDDVSNHRRRYRLAELRRAVTTAGFQVERIDHANVTFFLPILIVRKLMRLTGIRVETENSINIPALNRVFAALLGSERFWLHYLNIPFGVSGLCVARRVD
ncbi:MAG: class I SAM-dependent methyltransferase [Pyrinomonadaceae bacterium]